MQKSGLVACNGGSSSREVVMNLDLDVVRCNLNFNLDNSNLQGKSKKVRVIGSSSYRELEENSRE